MKPVVKQSVITMEHQFTNGDKMAMLFTEGQGEKCTYILKLYDVNNKVIGTATKNFDKGKETSTKSVAEGKKNILWSAWMRFATSLK